MRFSHPAARLVLAIFLVCGFAATLSAQPALLKREPIQQANRLAGQLLAIDREAELRFDREHPGVLPERKLNLPRPTATQFDWCNLNKVPDAHRQLTGDCWANAATEALEASYLVRNDLRVVLSVQPLLDRLKLGATKIGAQSMLAFDQFLKYGTAKLSDYPYTGEPAMPRDVQLLYRAVAWGHVGDDDRPPSIARIKEDLLRYGPLVVYLKTTPKFKAYRGGLFDEKISSDMKVGSHAVLLVGWDDTRGPRGAWKIKNTWGVSWGEQGFMWITYGTHRVAEHAMWVRAVSKFYDVPPQVVRLLPTAWPFPQVNAAGPAAIGPMRIAAADGPTSPFPLSGSQPTATEPISSTTETHPAASLPPDNLPFAVPNGTPDELLRYIHQVRKRRPDSDDNQAVREHAKRTARAVLEAADRILAARPAAEQTRAAFRYKLDALELLYRVRDPLAEDRLEQFPGELEKAGLQDLMPGVRRMRLGVRLRHSEGASQGELRGMLVQVRQYLKEGPVDRITAALAVDAARAADRSGNKAMAAQAYQEFGGVLGQSSNSAIARQGAAMQKFSRNSLQPEGSGKPVRRP